MKPSKIAFVPTAGALKFICWSNSSKRVPFWMTWPIMKPLLDMWIKKGSLNAFYLDYLKLETVARLAEAAKLYFEGCVNLIFLSGGQTGKRKKDSVELMKEFLLDCGMPEEDIFLDRLTLQSLEKVLSLISFIKNIYEQGGFVESIIPVVSWYNWFRIDYHLKKNASNWLNNGVAKYWVVYPPLNKACFKYEYLYNMAVEPVKIFFMFFPKVQKFWRKREEKFRGIE